MPPVLLVSVIIPTYGREAVLRETLSSVLQQDYSAYEVIVVDQTPTHEPETQQYLDRLVAEGRIRLDRVPWASLPGARNYAARRANGDVILFIDDDVLLPPGFVAAHARNYLDQPELGAVAGRVFDRMKLADNPTLAVTDQPPAAMDPAIAWYYIDLVHTVKPQQVLTARGCNMSFRRALFDKYGLRFDERFRGSAVREESDFCLQLRQTGLYVWYDPAAHLVHLGEETGGCHDISTRSLEYQITFYHNHAWLAFKHLTLPQSLRFFARLFDCHVLGRPPCNKSGSPVRIATRACFYAIGFGRAAVTWIQSAWDDGQIYSRLDAASAPDLNAPTPP